MSRLLYGFFALAFLQEPSEHEASLRLAVQTLATKLGVSEEDVRTLEWTPMTWPDSGLGCSRDNAAPAATAGLRVVLEAPGSAIYRVHVGAGRAVVCGRPLALASESPRLEEPPGTEEPVDPSLGPLVETAREDLARRLKVALDAIEVVEAKAVVWPDGGLGCPEEGMVYPQVTVDGARVRLKHGVTTYDYHSGGTRKLFLCEKPKSAGR